MLFLLYIRFTQRDLAGVRVGLRMLFELCVCVTQKDLGQSTDARSVRPQYLLFCFFRKQTQLSQETWTRKSKSRSFRGHTYISPNYSHYCTIWGLLTRARKIKWGQEGICVRMYVQKHVFKKKRLAIRGEDRGRNSSWIQIKWPQAFVTESARLGSVLLGNGGAETFRDPTCTTKCIREVWDWSSGLLRDEVSSDPSKRIIYCPYILYSGSLGKVGSVEWWC